MLKSVGLAFFLLACASCATDEPTPLPALRYELGELFTTAEGAPQRIRLDSGLEIDAPKHSSPLSPNSLLRVLVGYEVMPPKGATPKVVQLTPIPLLQAVKESEKQPNHPVRLLAQWRSSRYLNLRIGIGHSYGGMHNIELLDRGIATHSNGTRTQILELRHHNHSHRNDYTQEVLLSCPLLPLMRDFRQGLDSLRLIVSTPQGQHSSSHLY